MLWIRNIMRIQHNNNITGAYSLFAVFSHHEAGGIFGMYAIVQCCCSAGFFRC
jgi:hypothetical protein